MIYLLPVPRSERKVIFAILQAPLFYCFLILREAPLYLEDANSTDSWSGLEVTVPAPLETAQRIIIRSCERVALKVSVAASLPSQILLFLNGFQVLPLSLLYCHW